ncbi:PAS/PAC sensor hybrid histidine kinase [Desulfatibacillum aliphaticivorans]|uniref:histidine kinase n=1 Tax=Desulfatibacillum aliphaticivorans TaxID=218208 RepID=B8FG34_DESAL|nr:response regulator [Desulfatibacillum aliphaticivorans]ACL03714.1 PAS/PAC sensor hybrid histidine kinase [Desulfatibacillum aliphaticivorans]
MNGFVEKKGSNGLGPKLALGFAAVAIVVSGILTLALYFNVSNQLRENIEQRLLDTVSIAALQLDGDHHASIRSPESVNKTSYKKIKGLLQSIRARGADVRHIYTLNITPQGNLVYAVDGGGRDGDAILPNTPYNSPHPQLVSNGEPLQMPVVSKRLYTDESGTWLKGYAPFFSSQGEVAGILAMDVAASSIIARQRSFLKTALGVFGLSVVLAGFLGLIMGRKLAAPIEGLTRAVRAISQGDLSHRAEETAKDETGELARAFNAMSEKLSRAEDKIQIEVQERKEAQDALDQSEDNYQRLYENAHVGLFKTRFENDGITACNTRFARMLGYKTSQEVLGLILGPDRYADPADYQRLRERLASLEDVEHFETLFKKVDDSAFWIRLSARLTDQGESVEGMAIDFTTEKTAIEQIKSAEKKFRGIFENAQEGLFQCASEGSFISVNPAMARILGYDSPVELLQKLGPGVREIFFSPEEYSDFRSELEARGKVAGMEVQFNKKDGSLAWGSISATLVKNTETGALMLEGSLEDIEERKQHEAAILAKNQAVAANQEKNRFLAALSHEMRTPMTAIIGMTELLNETGLTQQQAQYIKLMKSANEQLLSLVSDVMDISRVDAGRLKLETIPFNLLELVEKACETMAEKAHEKNLELACSVSPKTPIHLLGDPYRLKQVLNNLMQNAVKFTEKGEVVVTVRDAAEGDKKDGQAVIEFCVSDTGIGIPSKRLASLFDHMAKDNDVDFHHYGGTGVGLSISRKLVEMMKGDFTVSSKLEQGSTFCFTACFGVQDKGSGLFTRVSPLKGLSVIVADQDPENLETLREVLNMWGARVTGAEDGPSAIDLLKETWMQPEQADLIIVDQDIPGMDGVETAAQVKMEHLCPACILMLKESPHPDVMARAVKAGITHFVQKPIDRASLLEIINKATKQAEMAEESGQTLPPLDILLVEDSETNRFVIRAYLKDTPWHIDMAENGERALAKFKSKKYDLVLMDIQMPVMDGYTTIRKIREWEQEHRNVRASIIATTIFASKDDETKCLEAGANSYLAKPVKKKALIASILNQIIGGRATIPEDLNMFGEVFFPAGDEPILAWVDPELADMAAHYLKTLPVTMQDLLDFAVAGDFKQAGQVGREIRDQSKALGLEEAQKIGALIKDAASTSNLDVIKECMEKMRIYLDRVQIV